MAKHPLSPAALSMLERVLPVYSKHNGCEHTNHFKFFCEHAQPGFQPSAFRLLVSERKATIDTLEKLVKALRACEYLGWSPTVEDFIDYKRERTAIPQEPHIIEQMVCGRFVANASTDKAKTGASLKWWKQKIKLHRIPTPVEFPAHTQHFRGVAQNHVVVDGEDSPATLILMATVVSPFLFTVTGHAPAKPSLAFQATFTGRWEPGDGQVILVGKWMGVDYTGTAGSFPCVMSNKNIEPEHVVKAFKRIQLKEHELTRITPTNRAALWDEIVPDGIAPELAQAVENEGGVPGSIQATIDRINREREQRRIDEAQGKSGPHGNGNDSSASRSNESNRRRRD